MTLQRELVPTGGVLVGAPEITQDSKTKMRYGVLDADSCMIKAYNMHLKMIVEQGLETREIGPVFWHPATLSYYVFSGSGYSPLESWLQ